EEARGAGSNGAGEIVGGGPRRPPPRPPPERGMAPATPALERRKDERGESGSAALRRRYGRHYPVRAPQPQGLRQDPVDRRDSEPHRGAETLVRDVSAEGRPRGPSRSEERRVGKECRWRGAREHWKKRR